MHRLNSLNWRRVARYATPSGFAAALVVASGAGATGPTTYSISSITESVSAEIEANLTVVLAIVGSLMALGIVIKMVRKFAHV